MKILIIGNKERYAKFRPDLPIYDESEKIFCPRGTSDQDLLKDGRDAEVILVDAINRLREEGHPLEEAIMMAAQFRIRPILMTSATTILAMLPMCFGFGEGASLRSPMALAVIGGLVTSTIMTLLVIPCVYYIFDRKKA